MNMSPAEVRHMKQVIAARYWLYGMAEVNPEYALVIDAMELCLQHHNGKRNGGEPEASHMIGIFHHVRTLHKHLKNPIIVYILIFCHDMLEDANQKTGAYIPPQRLIDKFGEAITNKVIKMSKHILGQVNPTYSLETIFEDEDCSIAKAGDRCNNISTMVGVFKLPRLLRYIEETRTKYLECLKTARRMYPAQESVYENFKMYIENQLILIQVIVDHMKMEEQKLASLPVEEAIELKQWRALSDPTMLYANLLRGVPAQLTFEQLQNLLGEQREEPKD